MSFITSDETIEERDADECLEDIEDMLLEHVYQHGDEPLPTFIDQESRSGTVQFKLSQTGGAQSRHLTYNETLPIMHAFGVKFVEEDYTVLRARVFLTQNGQLLAILSVFELMPPKLRTQTLPNPYPVPGSDITVEFEPSTSGGIDQNIATLCVVLAHDDIFDNIIAHGNEVMRVPMSWHFETVAIQITPVGPRYITYMQSLFLLEGFLTKMNAEGYQGWEAEVTATGDHVKIAEAVLYD